MYNAIPADSDKLGSLESAGVLRSAFPWLPLLPVLLVLTVFFVGPVALNLAESLTPKGAASLSALSYQQMLSDPYILKVGLHTLLLAAGTTVICLIFGYPFAYGLARSRGNTKAMLIFVLVAPLLVNVVVRSYGWMVVMGSGGVIDSISRSVGLPAVNLMYSWTAVLIALVHVTLPFMVLSIAGTLESLDLNIEDAAAVLGASPLRALLWVTVPMSIEGVITGSIIVFTLSVGSFVTVMLLGDNSTMVLPLLIYQRLTTIDDWPGAATLGISLFVLVMALLGLQAILRRALGWRAA